MYWRKLGGMHMRAMAYSLLIVSLILAVGMISGFIPIQRAQATNYSVTSVIPTANCNSMTPNNASSKTSGTFGNEIGSWQWDSRAGDVIHACNNYGPDDGFAYTASGAQLAFSYNGGTGLNAEYQCIELVARYIAARFGITNYSSPNAANVWSQPPNGFQTIANDGSSPLPVPGDILIWNTGGAGHIGIVAEVTSSYVYTFEQNQYLTGGMDASVYAYPINGSNQIEWKNTNILSRTTDTSGLDGWLHYTGTDINGQYVKANAGAQILSYNNPYLPGQIPGTQLPITGIPNNSPTPTPTPAYTKLVGMIEGNGNLHVRDDSLASPSWTPTINAGYTGSAPVIDFAISGNKIFYLQNNHVAYTATYSSNPFGVTVFPTARYSYTNAIGISGNRIGIIDTSNTLFIWDSGITSQSGSWVKIAPNATNASAVTSFALSGSKIVYRQGLNSYVIDVPYGQQPQTPTLVYPNTRSIGISGSRLGMIDTNNNVYIQDLTTRPANWLPITTSGNVSDFALTNTEVGYVINHQYTILNFPSLTPSTTLANGTIVSPGTSSHPSAYDYSQTIGLSGTQIGLIDTNNNLLIWDSGGSSWANEYQYTGQFGMPDQSKEHVG
jgi:CHAP domain